MKKRTQRTRNLIKAIAFVVIGVAIAFGAGFFMGYMYFTGTFLPYKYVLRKILYFLSAVICMGGVALADYGCSYLAKRLDWFF